MGRHAHLSQELPYPFPAYAGSGGQFGKASAPAIAKLEFL
jgi:hypothetical protein